MTNFHAPDAHEDWFPQHSGFDHYCEGCERADVPCARAQAGTPASDTEWCAECISVMPETALAYYGFERQVQ